MPVTSSNEGLTRAVHAVCAALAELRSDPAGEAVRRHIDAAEQALAPLSRDLTTIVLRRMLASVADCHRAGQSDSGTLADRERSAVRALRLDPRWNPRIGALQNVG